jgi:hypothetical protein
MHCQLKKFRWTVNPGLFFIAVLLIRHEKIITLLSVPSAISSVAGERQNNRDFFVIGA